MISLILNFWSELLFWYIYFIKFEINRKECKAYKSVKGIPLPKNFSKQQIDLWRSDYNSDLKPALVYAFANGEVATILTTDAQTGEHILSVGYYSLKSKFKENFINILKEYSAESTGSGL